MDSEEDTEPDKRVLPSDPKVTLGDIEENLDSTLSSLRDSDLTEDSLFSNLSSSFWKVFLIYPVTISRLYYTSFRFLVADS